MVEGNRQESREAFILHGHAYRETSLLLEVLTRGDGRISIGIGESIRLRCLKAPPVRCNQVLEPSESRASIKLRRVDMTNAQAAFDYVLQVRVQAASGY
jgi:hypothetical protein